MDGIYAFSDPGTGVTALNMNDEFNLFGKRAFISGCVFETYIPIEDGIVEKEIIAEEKEGSWFDNLATGILVTAALGVLAVAAIATGGAVLVFAGVCLAGAAVGAAVVTTAVAITDHNSGHARSWGEFLGNLAQGVFTGAVTAAVIYGVWTAIPAASQAIGIQSAIWLGGVSNLTVSVIPGIVSIGGYGIAALQGIRSLNELSSIGSGQNWILDHIFDGNQDNYDGSMLILDVLSMAYMQLAADNPGLGKKKDSKLPSYADDQLEDINEETWNKGPVVRGDDIDNSKKLKNNLGHNFPVVDKLDNGVLESTKSYDTTLPSYKNNGAKGFLSKLKADLNKIKNFTSKTFNGQTIRAGDYNSKQLNVVIPNKPLTPEQQDALQKAKEYAKSIGITLKVYITK